MRERSPEPWAEQWARVQRWVSRFGETTGGRVHDRESDFYQDEAYAFFQNCYHLKDWLKHDSATSSLVCDVEAFISSSQNLRLCADLCNGSKHLKLTRSRESPDTRIGKRDFSLSLGGSAEATISAKYEIESGGSTHDAFTVAEACMKEWSAYLKGKGLL